VEVPSQAEGALIDLSDRQFASEALDPAGKVRFLGIALPILALILYLAALASWAICACSRSASERWESCSPPRRRR